jgi:hypothetical protein
MIIGLILKFVFVPIKIQFFLKPDGLNTKIWQFILIPKTQDSGNIAYCLLPIAFCLLPIGYCLLPIAYFAF